MTERNLHNEENGLDILYKEIILEHYRSPHNKGRLNSCDISVYDNNPLCGDEVTVSAVVKGGIIEDIKIDPKGCSISVASSSMLTDTVKGKTVEEARRWIGIVRDLMHSKQTVTDEELGDLESLKGVAIFPVRVKCVLLSWLTLLKGLEGMAKANQGGRNESG